VSQSSLNHFIARVNSFPQLYDIEFWKNFSQIESNIDDILSKNEESTCEFLCELKSCYCCEGKLNSEADVIYAGRVYFYGKPSQSCNIGVKKCRLCGTEHYLNYADLPSGGRIFFEKIRNDKFLSFTNQTVFEKLLITSVKIDIFFKHSSFFNICQHHNELFNLKRDTYRNNLNEKRLAECWYQYNLIMLEFEITESKGHVSGRKIQFLDDSIKSRRKDFLPFFVKKWTSEIHFKNCDNKNCSFSVNVDGNWKCFRLKCAYEEVKLVSDELNPLKI
jgi:hypothetical protein